jgi:hypothetical protein
MSSTNIAVEHEVSDIVGDGIGEVIVCSGGRPIVVTVTTIWGSQINRSDDDGGGGCGGGGTTSTSTTSTRSIGMMDSDLSGYQPSVDCHIAGYMHQILTLTRHQRE